MSIVVDSTFPPDIGDVVELGFTLIFELFWTHSATLVNCWRRSKAVSCRSISLERELDCVDFVGSRPGEGRLFSGRPFVKGLVGVEISF